MPLRKDLAKFSSLARAGADSLRNVVNEPELSAWLEGIAAERLGPPGLAPEEAVSLDPTKESKAREWLAKVARKHQLREGLSAEVGPGEASSESSWSGLPWVRKALTEHRPLSRLTLPHEERERIASVLDWMRSDDGPPASGDWTRVSFEQAVKAEHDWIEAKAKAFAKRKQDEEAGQGTKLFLDLSSLGAKWEGWRWVKVESALALDREGALMKHCVGSYAKDVKEGHKEIYSLRDPADKPKLTVEAQGTTLAQLKGFANGACPAELREAAGAFAGAFERGVDPAGLGLVELSGDMERAGFSSLPWVGVFQREAGLSMEQRTCWEKRILDLAEGKGKETEKSIECEKLVCSLVKMGMVRELGELLPFLDPKVKHSNALGMAARSGHKEIVAMLLPLSEPLAENSLALRMAANNGHKEIVRMLLPLSNPKANNSEVLRNAAIGGHKEIVQMLLPWSDALAGDSVALREAATYGHKEIVEMLLPLSDALAGNSQALRWAARNGHKEILEILLPGSDALAEDSEALRLAASNGHKEIVRMLRPLSNPLTKDSQALCSAARGGHKSIVEMLLPLSEPKANDSQALRWAARNGHKEILEILLPGSDALAEDSEALRLAASNGHKEIVRMLLPLSNPLTRDSQALCSAARGGHKSIVEMLLPLSEPKANDSQALREAAGCGHKDVVEMLLPFSDPKACDSLALREAASAGHREIVQMLAHSYCGDEDTFHRLIKRSGMDSSGFHVSTLGADGDDQPMDSLLGAKIAGRRQKILVQELARELPGRPHGA